MNEQVQGVFIHSSKLTWREESDEWAGHLPLGGLLSFTPLNKNIDYCLLFIH